MLAEQSGKCAICRTWDGQRLRVDHDHKTGRVRSLLCNRCNSMLAPLEADPKWLDAARNYLDKHAEPARERGVAAKSRVSGPKRERVAS